MALHARNSPSSAKRWISCPGCLLAVEALPAALQDPPPTIYAATGTLVHDLAAQRLLNVVPYEVLQRFVRSEVVRVIDEFEIKITEKMVEDAEGYVRYVQSHLRPNAHLNVETRTSCAPWEPRVSGTADADVYDPAVKHLDVFDYKNGQVFVPVGDPQFRCYGAGRMLELTAAGHEVDTLSLHVVQPNAWSKGGPREPEFVTWRANDLFDWVMDELSPAVDKTYEPDAELVAGDHCRWCPAKAACPAFQAPIDEMISAATTKAVEYARKNDDISAYL